MVATVPKRLQTSSEVLQMHLLGGGGQPWLQPNCILRPAKYW